MFTQLDPMLPVETLRGSGYALGVIDYGQEHHLLWVVALGASGEIWCVANPEVRAQKNISMGRAYAASASGGPT